jgi:uncharacterized protein DUF6892
MAKIVDDNLRLTLLQSAWDQGLLPQFDKRAFYSDVLKNPYDPRAEYNDGIDERVKKHLLAIPLPKDLLAKLTLVTWDGGNEVFHHIWTNWDGESDEFAVHNLAGVEACRGLETLQFISGAQFKDCSQLAGLSNLEDVMLLGGTITDLRPLLKLPKLRKLEVVAEDDVSNRAALDELRTRGVSVTMY